jgi:hypothetical protein
MSRDIQITTEEFRSIRNGIITQFKATVDTSGFDSFADAMDKLNLWAVVDHQAEVIAYAYADNRRLSNIIHSS